MDAERYRVIVDRNAMDDLKGHRGFLADRASPETAMDFIRRAFDEMEKLERLPQPHASRRFSGKVPFELWQVPFGVYSILYTVSEPSRSEPDRVVRVVGVRHGGRR